MNQDGTLGFMLQGVSQQPERVQPEGHVHLQRNLLPDPNRGLSSRPGTTQLGKFPSVVEGGSYVTVRLAGELYFIAMSEGALSAYAYNGTEWTISDPSGLIDYIGNNCTAYATNGEIFLLNRDTIVGTASPAFDGIYDWGYAYALGGLFSRTYTLTLTYSDGAVAVGTYTTPDGDVAGDAALTTGSAIIAGLRTSLIAHANYKAANTTITLSAEYASIRVTGFTFSLRADDGENNVSLRAGVSAAATFADVPKFGIHGAVMRITGNVGTTSDEVWLRFFSDAPSPVIGNHFGVTGVWKETVDPESILELDRATLPHKLVPNYGTNTFTLAYGEWAGREIGNAESNEVPSFVGHAISDLGEFQSRLWFLAGGNFVASRTNERTNFWRKTAVNVLSTDAVDLTTAGEEESELTWGVLYDKNLVVFSALGQFFVDGESAFTPANGTIVRTTKYEMSTKARPVVAGGTVMFPYKSKAFSGVNEMRPSSQLLDNRVESINKVTPRYIVGDITTLASAGNAQILLVKTDAPAYQKTIWVYNFLWDNQNKVQSAWHVWDFAEDVLHVHVSEGVIYLWTIAADALRLQELLPDTPSDDVGYPVCLDFKQYVVSNADVEVDDGEGTVTVTGVFLERDDYVFIANSAETEYVPGRVVSPVTVTPYPGGFLYQFDGASPTDILAGTPYTTELIPNKPLARDWRGNVKPGAKIVLHKYVVDYVDSGQITAYMDNVYRSTDRMYVVDSGVFPVDDSPVDNFGTTIFTGSFDVPWGEDTSLASLVLVSNSVQPVTYVEIRWYGQVYVGKR